MSMQLSYVGSRTASPRVAIKAIRDREESSSSHDGVNVGQVERWASGVAGVLLAAHGLRRGTFGGLALSVLGGALAYRGFTGHCQAYEALNIDTTGKRRTDDSEHVFHGVLVKHTMTVNRTPGEIYEFVKDPLNYRQYMEDVESVYADADGAWRWAMKGPFGTTWQFRSRLINDKPGHLVAWKSLPGSDLENAGSIRLVQALGGRGTEVTIEVNYEPPAGAIGVAISRVIGHNPDTTVRENLRHLKQIMEAGEVPTVEGQPSGRA